MTGACAGRDFGHVGVDWLDDRSTIFRKDRKRFMQFKVNRLGAPHRKGPARAAQDNVALGQLEQQLKQDFLREAGPLLPLARIEHALREAAAQAATTTVPVLWFPELAREKFVEARAWARRQQQIRVRSFVSFSA